MDRFGVQLNLEEVKRAREQWAEAKATFDANIDFMMRRLILEAATNRMSADDIARYSGFSVKNIRARFRMMRINPHKSKSLISKQAADAMATNAELMGIEPHEIDLTSPLAYLPMGEELRVKLQEQTIARVDIEEASEVERLRDMLNHLGFCADCEESMPCTQCGAGL